MLPHTAGFGYDFFNETYNRLAQEQGQPSVITASKDALMTPLLHDPGDVWKYGSNMDWGGQVVEGITGLRLGEVFQKHIFDPLGIENMTFELNDDLRARLATMHSRGTVGDYMRFIRMWLNDGQGEHGQVLKPETVRMAEQNQLGSKKICALPGVIPSLSNDAEFFPGQSKSWALSFMVNDEQAPTGRPAGALGWADLANLFYWIDRQNGHGGFWATQRLPFADAASFTGYMQFETAFYESQSRTRAA